MLGSATGYVTDAGYADTFFRELSPVWLNYVAVCNAVAPRDLARGFTYLELGCGYAGSTIVNAAAFPQGEFHACDLNPTHIDGAREHARALGVGNVHFHACSFDLLPADLPAFDFIAMHGVYSWVNREARDAALRILRERLKPDGLAYVSYNCWPGWSVEAPLRRLLLELAANAAGDTRERVEHAVSELTRLHGGKLRYFLNHPELGAALEAYRRGGSSYLAHEFFNETWEPFHSVDVHDEMDASGLSYVGSATLVDNYPMLLVDDSTTRAIAALATARQQQLAMDLAVDRRFRRDVFVRGAQRLDALQAAHHVRALIIGCAGDLAEIRVKVRVPRGEINFSEGFIAELRELVALGAVTMEDAVTALTVAGRNAAEIARNLTLLVAAGSLMPYARTTVGGESALSCKPANAAVAQAIARVAGQRSEGAIPSEVLGNGMCIHPLEARALTLWMAGTREIDALAAHLRSSIDLRELHTPPNAAMTRDICHTTAVRVLERLVPMFVRLGLVV